jgi:thiamine-phosphate pyrophosphorylase
MTLDRFYPIFDSPAWLARMLPLGARLVQLRMKDATEDTLRSAIAAARDLCRRHGAVLVVNDYWKIAIELGCDWIHLGQEDLDTADITAIRRAGLRIGVSTHDHAELERGLSIGPDYVALGPIYPTILKQMKWHEQGLGRLAEWRRLVGAIPLVGIGGMTLDRAAGVFAAGADIVSVVTDITLDEDPERKIRQWLAATR